MMNRLSSPSKFVQINVKIIFISFNIIFLIDISYLIVLTFDLDYKKIVFRSKVVLPLSFYFLVH
ncbi:hypothetical protein NARC_90083 [Candidatus Nitrosocosmicus arcticus]|uniref:Uncharacterized protein n=1 Tax=Candidatus Nitrosocosmicus arcticus TaxID=2035267 RepID=A0A557SU95_9ARCH|nr:hypothetical protein NARC_90083 [Candidatus Nitrosocosmicus arcticus]